MENNLKKILDEKGIAQVYPFSSDDLIQIIRAELSEAFHQRNSIKQVDQDNIKIKSLNGSDLLDFCPSVHKIYLQTFHLLKENFDTVYELSDSKIGISANYLNSSTDKFRLHFDRNQLTVVIYLNQCKSFPMLMYTNVRRDPIVTGAKDNFSIDENCPVKIYPEPNLALIFYGRRSFHGVMNESNGLPSDRYSLQFAFDLQPHSYQNESYYGV
jgi:hypothetical protein